MIRQIFKHSGIFFLGSTFSKIVSTLAWILLARVLSPEYYGQFTLYFMLMQFVTFLADFGLNQYYLKYVEDYGRSLLFNKILYVRSLTLVLSTSIVGIFLLSFNIFTRAVSLIFILSMIPMAYLSISDGYYLEQKKTLRVSLKLASIGIIFLLGYSFLLKSLNLLNSTTVLLFSFLLTLVWFFPWKEIKIKIISFSEVLFILKTASSYAYLTLTSYFYNKGDSFIISYLKGNVALGIYGLAYRVLESLSLFPSSLVQNLFPVSAKKSGITSAQLKKITLLMFLFGLFFAFGVFIFSSYLIKGFFPPAYFQAIPIMQIFALVILLFFINAPLATVVQSSKLVRAFLPYGISNTLLNIFLNLLFIPFFGIIAAAWMMVTTEITGLIINLFFVKKLYQTK